MSTHRSDGSATHYPQLDGLRGWAVLAVLWYHAAPNSGWPSAAARSGEYAVWLFFTLSAFLITGILLRLRDAHAPIGQALRTFYVRRTLRIFPAYYLVALTLIALGIEQIGPYRWAILTFTTNWRMFTAPYLPSFGHFWTLAVEEQFYLAWPLVVLTLSPRRLPVVLMACVAFAVVSKAAWQIAGAPGDVAQSLTTSNLDTLGLGALLAWHRHERRDEQRRRSMLRVGLVLGLGFLALTYLMTHGGYRLRVVGFEEGAAMGLVSVWLIDRAVRGAGGVLLSARPIAYIGTVSYAVYLVQSPVCWFLRSHGGSLTRFGVATVVSVGLASLSMRFLERPLNALKRRVPYPVARRAPVITPVAVPVNA